MSNFAKSAPFKKHNPSLVLDIRRLKIIMWRAKQESLEYTSQVGERFTTCSRMKGLYSEDLKLEKEEEGEGGGRWAIYTQRVSGDIG